MRVELLYFEGYPNAEVATQSLRLALEEEGIDAKVVLVPVETDEESERLRFPGSPTIRIDGEDAFPVSGREDWTLTCRTYSTSEGLRGAPSVEMLWPKLASTAARNRDGRA